MAAWDVERCPVHHVKLKRGRCEKCRREAIRAKQIIYARAMPRDEHGTFLPKTSVTRHNVGKSVDDGDNS